MKRVWGEVGLVFGGAVLGYQRGTATDTVRGTVEGCWFTSCSHSARLGSELGLRDRGLHSLNVGYTLHHHCCKCSPGIPGRHRSLLRRTELSVRNPNFSVSCGTTTRQDALVPCMEARKKPIWMSAVDRRSLVAGRKSLA